MGASHCFLPREIVILLLESGKVLFIHAWRYSKLERDLQQVRQFTYCTVLGREQIMLIFFFYPTLPRKCFTKTSHLEFSP